MLSVQPDLTPDYLLNRLLEEIALAIAQDDMPVGCALTIDGKLQGAAHNTVRSQQGRRFHAERNLLAQLADKVLPAGRRVLWVTLEPCLRCAQAIRRFGIDEVVYVLDDPFGGGKTLLAEAGITLTQQHDWEHATLQQVMNSFTRNPELCAGPRFPLFLAALQRHQQLGRHEQVKAVFLNHLAPYLTLALASVPMSRHKEIRQLFLRHMEELANLTLLECTAMPSLAFIRKLHQALFPPNFHHQTVGNDGVVSETASGEWRRHMLLPQYAELSPPESIEIDMTGLLDVLSAKEPLLREDVLRFVFEFCAVSPFADGNGRLAALLADVICLNRGLVPLTLDRKNGGIHRALMENLARGVPVAEQLNLIDAWNRGAVTITPRSIYDDRPSAYQTYMQRSGNRRHVVAQVLAKLADQPLNPPFVVTDIGAGAGIVADGIVQALLQREGMAFEYHYLEPAPASVEYFQQHSRHAGLPQVEVHNIPNEDFLLPPSDLILLVQTMQYLANPDEVLRDVIAALKPGGLALLVCDHPNSDEWRMMSRLSHKRPLYEHLKELLDKERIGFTEVVLESTVHLTLDDRNTPEGDDLLTYYFNAPATTLPIATKAAFWEVLADFAKEGGISKKEAFFWMGREIGNDSMDSSLPVEARLYWNFRYTAFSRFDDGIQFDWQGLYSVKPEVLALQLARTLPGKVVLDAFCGIGGCAIAFARSGKKVLAVEIDKRRLEMARNNARVYGVEDRITFIHGDAIELIGSLRYDAAFLDPPWGGGGPFAKTCD